MLPNLQCVIVAASLAAIFGMMPVKGWPDEIDQLNAQVVELRKAGRDEEAGLEKRGRRQAPLHRSRYLVRRRPFNPKTSGSEPFGPGIVPAQETCLTRRKP